MESWVNHANVSAIVWAGLPGQEAGNALVDVLYGAYNPSGRLPYTIAKKLSDNPAQIILTDPEAKDTPQVPYLEQLNLGYRHFLADKIEPRFGFGFGLSYTDFGYDNLEVTEQKMSKRDFNDEQQYNGDSGFAGEVGASVAPWLHATRYTVEVSPVATLSDASRPIARSRLTPPKLACAHTAGRRHQHWLRLRMRRPSALPSLPRRSRRAGESPPAHSLPHSPPLLTSPHLLRSLFSLAARRPPRLRACHSFTR